MHFKGCNHYMGEYLEIPITLLHFTNKSHVLQYIISRYYWKLNKYDLQAKYRKIWNRDVYRKMSRYIVLKSKRRKK